MTSPTIVSAFDATASHTSMPSGPRPVRAPRGSALSCMGWEQEAALRMLMNNLDAEVAEVWAARTGAAGSALSVSEAEAGEVGEGCASEPVRIGSLPVVG